MPSKQNNHRWADTWSANGLTITPTKVEQNTAIDDSVFSMPAQWRPSKSSAFATACDFRERRSDPAEADSWWQREASELCYGPRVPPWTFNSASQFESTTSPPARESGTVLKPRIRPSDATSYG